MSKQSSGWFRALSRVTGAVVYFIDSASFLGVVAGAVVGLFAVIIIAAEVVIRYGRLSNVTFADELSGYAFAFVCAMGAAYAMKEGAFIRLTFIVDRLGQRVQDVLMLLAYIVGLVVVGMLTFQFWGYFMQSVELKSRSASPLHVPIWVPQVFVVIGFGLLCLQLLVLIIRGILGLIRRREFGPSSSG